MPIIKVKDYSGADRAYDTSQCKDTLLLPLADGSGNAPFSYGVTASETVALDFSGGDMTITPAAGQVLSGLTIPKPETLIPENIKEGVNIAGILGTLATGGGGGSAKVAFSTFPTLAAGLKTVEFAHDLGTVPDLVVGICKAQTVSTAGAYILVGYSAKFAEKIGQSAAPQRLLTKNGSNVLAMNGTLAIDADSTTTTAKMITATASKVYFGTTHMSSLPLTPLSDGYWFAVAGLV